ncbi:MAG: DNA replication and repair protein RecF [Patescibacteria group bacterium]
MILRTLSLQHFRNYTTAAFQFDPRLTVVVGPNAVGKTNFVESLVFSFTGKSFKSEKDGQVILFGKPFGRIKAIIEGEDTDSKTLEMLFTDRTGSAVQKKYLVNSIPRRRVDFASHLPVVLFTPETLDLVSGQPSMRRNFLNEILEQIDTAYTNALTTYTKALRQRNALLEQAREQGYRDEERFAYWDTLLIKTGNYITKKREELITQINKQEKKLFPFTLEYDKSSISVERLAQYKHAEIGSGVTLVGPHRDEVFIQMEHPVSGKREQVRSVASRGQQRLVTLELKFAQITLIAEALGKQPLLLLDDIFSELDSGHIQHVLTVMDQCQTVLTTTHKEFLSTLSLGEGSVIELKNDYAAI